MTYRYHRPSGFGSQRSSENWMKPPYRYTYHKRSMKRRCSSPSFFPRKVHISEEIVAEQLGNLSIGREQNQAVYTVGNDGQKPDSLDSTNRIRTFQDVEDSIETDGICNLEEINLKGTVELAPELLREIRKLNRRILTATNFRLSTKRLPVNPCQELVLWKPPSGSIVDVPKAVKEAADKSTNDEDYHHKHAFLRLDSIEEEARFDVGDFTMTDLVAEHQNSTINPLPNTPSYMMNPHLQQQNSEPFDDALMDLTMEL